MTDPTVWRDISSEKGSDPDPSPAARSASPSRKGTSEATAAFTPGPWAVYQHFATDRKDLFDVVGATRDDDVANDCSLANAHLIAAAPDMAAALEPFAELAEETEAFSDEQLLTVRARDVRRAYAALAKALPPPPSEGGDNSSAGVSLPAGSQATAAVCHAEPSAAGRLQTPEPDFCHRLACVGLPRCPKKDFPCND